MKNLYIQANRQIHPSEELKNQTIMKMNCQMETRSWFSSKMALAFVSCCLCFGLCSILLDSLSHKTNEGADNTGLMLANDLESQPQSFVLNNEPVYPNMIEDYQLIMEAYNEDGSTTLVYQKENDSFTVHVLSVDDTKLYEGVILEKEDQVLLFESDVLSKEELEEFVDYFK